MFVFLNHWFKEFPLNCRLQLAVQYHYIPFQEWNLMLVQHQMEYQHALTKSLMLPKKLDKSLERTEKSSKTTKTIVASYNCCNQNSKFQTRKSFKWICRKKHLPEQQTSYLKISISHQSQFQNANNPKQRNGGIEIWTGWLTTTKGMLAIVWLTASQRTP